MRHALAFALFLSNACGQAVITDSGSTNRPGMTITLGAKGHALLSDNRGNKSDVILPFELQTRFMRDLETASPLNEIKAGHCMKSVSFGSNTFITYKGVRSPDLSCGQQTNSTAAALQKDLQEIMMQARTASSPDPMKSLAPRN